MTECLFTVIEQLRTELTQLLVHKQELETRLDLLEAPPPPSEIYTWSDLIYRNDAQDPKGVTMKWAMEVGTVHDLSQNQAHLDRQIIGRYTSSTWGGVVDGEGILIPGDPMLLTDDFNGHKCFDGYIIQGKVASYTSAPGNVLLSNSDHEYTFVQVYKREALTYGALVSLGTRFGENRGVRLYVQNYDFYKLFENTISHITGAHPPLSTYVLVVYRSSAITMTHALNFWNINTGDILGNVSSSIDPLGDPGLVTPSSTGSPLYIGCDDNIYHGGIGGSASRHIHGETIIYNKYLDNTQVTTLKDYLIKKWKPVA